MHRAIRFSVFYRIFPANASIAGQPARPFAKKSAGIKKVYRFTQKITDMQLAKSPPQKVLHSFHRVFHIRYVNTFLPKKCA